MRISRMISGAALAAMLIGAAAPASAAAQIGKLIKGKVKEKVVQTVIETGAGPDTIPEGARVSPPGAGRLFNENTLEITSELLDRVEKGLAAEEAVRQEVERKIGKVLGREEYDQCEAAVLRGPEGMKVYEQARNLATGDTSYEHITKASEELARRMEAVIEPKCGLEPSKAEGIRSQHAERIAAAGPEASGLTPIQLSIMKERILPLCTAAPAVAAAAGEVRVPAGEEAATNPIYYVYTPGEVDALQPRCEALRSALAPER